MISSIIEGVCGTVFLILIVINLFACFLGVINGLHGSDACGKFDRPVYYIAPAFHVGCWLVTPFKTGDSK